MKETKFNRILSMLLIIFCLGTSVNAYSMEVEKKGVLKSSTISEIDSEEAYTTSQDFIKTKKVKVKIDEDNMANHVIIDLFPGKLEEDASNLAETDLFVNFFGRNSDMPYFMPGDIELLDLSIENDSDSVYKIRDFDFWVMTGGSYNLINNQKAYDEGYRYYQESDNSVDPEKIIKDMDQEEWAKKLKEWYPNIETDVGQMMDAFKGIDYSQGLAVTGDTLYEYIANSIQHILQWTWNYDEDPVTKDVADWKKEKSLIYNSESNENERKDIINNQKINKKFGREGFSTKIGHSASQSMGNTYSFPYILEQFKLELIRTDLKVEYDVNGGIGTVPIDNNSYDADEEVTVKNIGDIVRPGYKFIGWKSELEETVDNTDLSRNYQPLDKFNIESNTKLVAQWEKAYKIEFDSQGGSTVNSQEVLAGQLVSRPANPIKEGFNFKGWKLNGQYWDFENNLVNEDIVLIADWESEDSGPIYVPDIPSKPNSPDEPSDNSMLNKKDHYGYIKGYIDNTVRPENNITREEVSVVFYRLLQEDYKNEIIWDKNVFSDIKSNRWSNKEISTLNNGKIIEGYDDGTFKPDHYITRAEVAAIASRFDELSGGTNKFKDVDDNHWAKDYIVSASEKGWVKGYEDGTFKPDEKITRFEFVTLVNGVLNRGVKEENILQGIKEFDDLMETKWYYTDMVEAINGHDYYRMDDKIEIWTKLNNKYFY